MSTSDRERVGRVVVVGGTGHISGSLVNALVAANYDVTIFVRGNTRRILPDGVRTLRGDRNDRQAFERLMRDEAFDAAFDLICWGPEDAESDLRAFAETGHFFQTSTVCTLGGPLANVPADELTAMRPISDYGRAKVAADEVFLRAYQETRFPVTVIKPANIWGAGMPLVRQLDFDPHWIDRVRAEKPLLIAGDGRQRWSMCHVLDAVEAYIGLLGLKDAIGETFLLSSPGSTTWLHYHREIAGLLGVQPILLEAPVSDLLRLWPEGTELLAEQSQWDQVYDIGKLQTLVPSFRPELTLRDRAIENIEWMDRANSGPAGGTKKVPDREEAVISALGLR